MNYEQKAPKIGTPEWIFDVGAFDPFEGDFGDGTERTLRDEVVIAKRSGRCRNADMFEGCEGVKKGEYTRVIKKADSEGFYGGRVCQSCLDAALREMYGDDDDGPPE